MKTYLMGSASESERPIPGGWVEYTSAIEGPFADSTWPYTMRQNAVGNSSFATFTRGYAIIAKGEFLCSKLQIIFTQKNSGDTMKLGIYDSNYHLVASTALFTVGSVTGYIGDIPLTAPYLVGAKKMYYLAFGIHSEAPGNTKWPVITDADTLNAEPLSQVSDPSNMLPNSIGIGSIINAYRVWMGWSA